MLFYTGFEQCFMLLLSVPMTFVGSCKFHRYVSPFSAHKILKHLCSDLCVNTYDDPT